MLGVVALALILLQAYRLLPPKNIIISTGREGGAYHQFGLEYQQVLAKEGFKAQVQPGPGSVATLQKLVAGEVSAGFVQGGTANSLTPDQANKLISLGSMFYEPIWVFYRKALPVQYIFDLRGKRIAIGEEGSGTRPLALLLLADNGINTSNSTLSGPNTAAIIEQLTAGQLDAAFFVASPRADSIRSLIQIPNVDVLDIKRFQAYHAKHPFITSVEIGEGAVDIEHNLPKQNKTLLAVTANLIVPQDLHPGQIRALLTAADEIHSRTGVLEAKDAFPSTAFTEITLSSYAERYIKDGPSWLDRIFPGEVVTVIDPLLFILLPLIALYPLLSAIPNIFNFGISRYINRWYGRLRLFELRVNTIGVADIPAEIERVQHMSDEITDKTKAAIFHNAALYDLKSHVDFVLQRLRKRLADES